MPETTERELQLYFDFLSQPSRALYILLHASGQPFVERRIDLLAGENLSDDYKVQVNRFQKVPAIIEQDKAVDGDGDDDDDDEGVAAANGADGHADDNGDGAGVGAAHADRAPLKLAESIAILRYLAATDRLAERFYPSDLHRRARVDEYLCWQHNGIRTSCSLYFRFVWVQAYLTGQSADEAKIAKYRQRMESDFALLEQLWLGDTPFVAGDELTAADVFGACEVEQIRTTGYEVSLKYPKVAQWVERVRAALQPHYDVAHQTVCKYEMDAKAAAKAKAKAKL